MLENVKKYFLLGNLGQIINFATTIILVIILKFISKKYQIIINLTQLILFLCVVIPASIIFGMTGIIYAILVVNFIKLILAFLVGYTHLEE